MAPRVRPNQSEPAAPAINKLPTPGGVPSMIERLPESGTVTVASKLPNGLVLQLCRKEDMVEAMPGGHRTVDVYRRHGKQYVLNKARVPFGQIPEYKIIGGYALTDGIPVEFFREWLKQNHDSPIVVNRLIYAFEKASDSGAAARDHKTLRSGLEPILPDKDPRMPKGIGKADRAEIEKETTA